MDIDLRSEAEKYSKQALSDSNREWYGRVVAALDERDAEIERLRAALNEIERKYAAIMNDPPEWVGMTDERLKWVREAWYGASLIARRALEQKAGGNDA